MAADPFFKKLIPFFRDNLLTSGVSAAYHDYKQLYYYYQQANAALEIGNKKAPSDWYYFFEDYRLDYLLGKCSSNSISDVWRPGGIKRVKQHDLKKYTQYTQEHLSLPDTEYRKDH